MTLQYHPDPGTIVLCNYDTGFSPPEMVKRRLAVIISPRLRNRNNLCTVVPLSQTEPEQIQDYHYRLVLARRMPGRWGADGYWVKGDMLATVAFHRLNLVGIGRENGGPRRYITKTIPDEDLQKIRACALHALGMSALVDGL